MIESAWRVTVCEDRDVCLARGIEVGNVERGASLGRSHRHRH